MSIEITFIFSLKRIIEKAEVNENQNVGEVLNEVITKLNDDSFQDMNISLIICNSNIIDMNNSFKNNNIKNKDTLLIVYYQDKNADKEKGNTISDLIDFRNVGMLTNHAYVNLEDSVINAFIDRTFDAFKSLNNEYLLICAQSLNYKHYFLTCFDLINQKFLFAGKNAHNERVFTCKHYMDEINHRDLLLTSSFDKTIKIWNITNNEFQLLFQKKPDYEYEENTYLLSECLLTFNNSLYLITSAYELYSNGYDILYYDSQNLNTVNYLNDSRDNCNYLETLNKDEKTLIIAGNLGNIKIFDFETKSLIKKFYDKKISFNYLSIVIQAYKNKECLIASSSDGFIRIWDYSNPSMLLTKIKNDINSWLIGLKPVNEQFLLAGSSDGNISIFDLSNDCLAWILKRKDESDPIFTIKNIQILGKNLMISHSHKGLIELWINK